MTVKITALNHVGIRVTDLKRATRFYTEVLGLTPRPEKPNWLDAGGAYCVHLMPAAGGPEPVDVARHVAFEVADLRDAAAKLLDAGLRPYQTGLEHNRREVTGPDDPLDFGIGTVFVEDTEGNTVEFLQFGHGWLFSSEAVHYVDEAGRAPGS